MRIDGDVYHHATGFMECMRHRRNPEFAEAIRREPSASIAREMGDPGTLKWADLDLGKRALTPEELGEFERLSDRYAESLRHAAPWRGPEVTRWRGPARSSRGR